MKIRVSGKSGSLSQRTKTKRLANGEEKEYPLVRGERDPERYDHWFWQYTYKEKQEDGKFRTRTVSVSQTQAPVVRGMIRTNGTVAAILEYLIGSK
jgi:hypothetical protein